MPRDVKTRFGVAGEKLLPPVTVRVPDGEPDPWGADDKLQIVGKRVPRLDAVAKVTGKARYTTDIKRPGMLHGAILRSPHPAAEVRRVDARAAERLAGVKAVILTGVKEVRYAGQEIAAVAATTPHLAAEALRLIKVDYKPKPFVVELDEAIKPSSPAVYRASAAAGIQGNVRAPRRFDSRGGTAAALKTSPLVVKGTFRTRVQTHSCLETHCLVAEWKGDKLTAWCSTQGTFSVQNELASHFNLPRSNVRVFCEYIGGGFGSKFGAGAYGILCAQLARKAGAPVRLVLTRKEEHMVAGNRPDSRMQLQAGAKRDGTLTAISHVSHGTAGVGGGAGTSRPMQRLYRVPYRSARDHDVLTNNGSGRPFRAPGHPQGCFSLEQMIDQLAYEAKMDPLKFRLHNDPHPVRRVEMQRGADKIGWARRHQVPGSAAGPRKRGIGMASGLWYNTGRGPAEAQIKIHSDGSIELLSGAQDIGTGMRTIIAMVCAEELGVPLGAVRTRIGDTDLPYGPGSGGSKTTPSLAPAVRSAAHKARRQVFALARQQLGVGPKTPLDAADGKIFVRGQAAKQVTFKQVVRRLSRSPLTVGSERPANFDGWQSTVAGVQFAEVEVDVQTGQVRVLRVVAVQDCGRVINRLTCESQLQGGVIQGVSYALYEERILDPQTGLMVNANLEQYKIAGARDTPEIDAMLIDVYNGSNNTGAVGIGEPATVPTAAAIANAVYNAIGVRLYEIPLTPARVLAALAKGGAAR